ncbi:MAG: hypothetical protein ACR2HA_11250 [Nocardioides sp.]
MRLPTFDVDGYRRLLTGLAEAGSAFATVGTLREEQAIRTVYLRHDVDFDPRSALPIADTEAG